MTAAAHQLDDLDARARLLTSSGELGADDLDDLGEELKAIEGTAIGAELDGIEGTLAGAEHGCSPAPAKGTASLDAPGAELGAIEGPLTGAEHGCSPAPRARSPARCPGRGARPLTGRGHQLD